MLIMPLRLGTDTSSRKYPIASVESLYSVVTPLIFGEAINAIVEPI